MEVAVLGALSLIVLMVSWGRKATEGGEKNRRKKEEEAATAEDEDKFTVMIMDTVDTVSPINIFHCHVHGHCRHSFTH